MTWYFAVILALVTGLTEILPISGTGHRLIFEKVFGLPWSDPALHVYRAMLYLGTALALLLFYRHRISMLLRELLVWLGIRRPGRRRQRGASFGRREMILTLLALLPAAALPFVRKYAVALESGENALPIAAAFLGLSGVVLFLSDRGYRKKKTAQDLTIKNALVTGAAQTASVFSGASRAALTVSSLLASDFDRGYAVEYSGTLGIPVLVGAGISELMTAVSLGAARPSVWHCVIGILVSMLTALLTLRFWTNSARRHRVTTYAFWCWGAGIVAMILFLVAA